MIEQYARYTYDSLVIVYALNTSARNELSTYSSVRQTARTDTVGEIKNDLRPRRTEIGDSLTIFVEFVYDETSS